MEGRVGCPSRRGGAYRRDERARAVADRHATSDMSDSNQTAARLAQVARRLEGAGGGFPEASTSGSGPLADDGLPREPTLVTLVDVGTGRAYHAVTLEDGSIVLELSSKRVCHIYIQNVDLFLCCTFGPLRRDMVVQILGGPFGTVLANLRTLSL